jgi:hypothetical protein
MLITMEKDFCHDTGCGRTHGYPFIGFVVLSSIRNIFGLILFERAQCVV